MICKKCGNTTNENAKYCSHCGNKLKTDKINIKVILMIFLFSIMIVCGAIIVNKITIEQHKENHTISSKNANKTVTSNSQNKQPKNDINKQSDNITNIQDSEKDVENESQENYSTPNGWKLLKNSDALNIIETELSGSWYMHGGNFPLDTKYFSGSEYELIVFYTNEYGYFFVISYKDDQLGLKYAFQTYTQEDKVYMYDARSFYADASEDLPEILSECQYTDDIYGYGFDVDLYLQNESESNNYADNNYDSSSATNTALSDEDMYQIINALSASAIRSEYFLTDDESYQITGWGTPEYQVSQTDFIGDTITIKVGVYVPHRDVTTWRSLVFRKVKENTWSNGKETYYYVPK